MKTIVRISPEEMKFVALLSGGKDSCYNTIKCQQYGHELVCLANLCPPSSFSGEEMNSFMYQSAAHSVIPLMEECFGVPLIRREILGTAVRQGLDYEESKEDEVEDLFLLLKAVKDRFPDCVGVSCGAIVSTYQRFRVENVCSRLGMTPLTYLWMRDRPELLHEIVDSGLDAVLVKVAGAGLDPYKHLGKSLAELRPTLFRLNARFGLDVCGEGGEFESLVLDCSAFRKRIVIDASEVLLDDEDPAVGNLRILACHCEDKEFTPQLPEDGLWKNRQDLVAQSSAVTAAPITGSAPSGRMTRLPTVSVASSGLGQTELIAASPTSALPLSSSDVRTQLRSAMERLASALRRVGASLADIVFVHLYIARIDLFGPVNEEYCKWFGKYPPSRSCVAVPLDLGVGVALDAVFLRGSHAAVSAGEFLTRSVLHVQSMSEWAPLCIGPYSQANCIHDCLLFPAGQIALNPSTMTLLSSEGPVRELFYSQLALACRHLSRVLGAMGSSLHRLQCCTVLVNTGLLNQKSDQGWNEWDAVRAFVQELVKRNFATSPAGGENAEGEGEDMDDQSEVSVDVTDRRVPVQVVGVSGLPRDALVEVEVVSFRDNAIPTALFKFVEDSLVSSQAANTSSTAVSTAEWVNSWPLWQVGGPSADGASELSYRAESRIIKFDRSLFSGFSEVLSASVEELDLDLAVKTLVRALAKMAREAEVSLNHALLTFRVYFPSFVEKAALSALVARHLAIAGVTTHRLPLCLIPVDALRPDAVLAAQVVAVDAHQMLSELWIHNK